MAFTNSNDLLTGRLPVITPSGIEITSQRGAIAIVAADLDINDTGAVVILPAGCVPLGVIYDSDDLDTNGTPTLVASVGLVNAGVTDLDTVWATGITASQNGTAVQVVSPAMIRTAPAQVDRKVGIKFTAASATKAAGTVGLTLLYRAA